MAHRNLRLFDFIYKFYIPLVNNKNILVGFWHDTVVYDSHLIFCYMIRYMIKFIFIDEMCDFSRWLWRLRWLLKSRSHLHITSHLLTATRQYKKEKERAPASAKNKNPRRHVWKIKKVLAHQMVGSMRRRRETRFWAGCDLPCIFICTFERGENWITNLIKS